MTAHVHRPAGSGARYWSRREAAFGAAPMISASAGIWQLRHVPSADLIAMLDAGGYARYDLRTATRLLQLCEIIDDRYDGQVGLIGRRFAAYPELRAALDALPGWGPVTVRLFLRELRGVWPGAGPPLDERAAAAARHLGLAERQARGDGPGRAGRGVRAGRARPGKRAGPAGSGARPGDDPLPGRPGLHGAAAAGAARSVVTGQPRRRRRRARPGRGR